MNDIELKIVIGLHRNVGHIDKNSAKVAAEYGLTLSQFAVLEALYSKGEMSVGMVRELILSSVGTIPLIINNLVKMNYVKRRTDEKDRRICMISLTETGKQLIADLAPKNKKVIKDYINVLTNEEKENLLYLLKKLGGKINETNSSE